MRQRSLVCPVDDKLDNFYSQKLSPNVSEPLLAVKKCKVDLLEGSAESF